MAARSGAGWLFSDCRQLPAACPDAGQRFPQLLIGNVQIALRGLLRRKPDLDIIRVQDAGLAGADDATLLEWAPVDGRVVVITHDVSTLTKHAYGRVAAGRPMPGVFEVASGAGVGSAIDDLSAPRRVQL